MGSVFLSLPLWLSAALAMGAVVGLGMALSLGCQVAAQHQPRIKALFAGLIPTVGTTMTAGCFLWLSFFTSTETADIKQADQAVQAEAHAIQQLDELRAMAAVPSSQSQALGQALQAYAHAVVTREWPQMTQQQHSNEAAADLLRVRKLVLEGFLQESAGLQSSLQQAVRDLMQARELRMAIAKDRLPLLTWLASLACIVLVLLYAAMLHAGTGQHGSGRLMNGLLACMLGLHFYTVSMVAQPFVGRIAVSPEPIAQALSAP